MPPKRKVAAEPLPAPSPRRTRSSTASAVSAAPPAKKSKSTKEGKRKGAAKGIEATVDPPADGPARTIIVEACNQCHQFKKRAMIVKDGLVGGVPGVTVVVNPDKPRRGCFEIRKADGETFVSLLNMKRPYNPMRELDMEALVADIIQKIK